MNSQPEVCNTCEIAYVYDRLEKYDASYRGSHYGIYKCPSCGKEIQR